MIVYLQYSLWEIPVEESNHFLDTGAFLGSHCDHVAIPKPEQESIYYKLCIYMVILQRIAGVGN